MACIKMAGAKPVPVTLYGPDFSLDEEKIEKAFTSKTKAIFLNSPHNPTGKVFTKKELEFLSTLILKHDVYVISDEVYEFLTFDDHVHIPMATLPSMKERTFTISSGGKTFGLTGWKIGWCAAPEHLTKGLRMVHQFNSFSVAHPLQMAMAHALDNIDKHLKEFRPLYHKKRNLFFEGLKKAKLNPILPEGTYFILCQIPENLNKTDIDFCYDLMKNKKVAAIPPSAFYSLNPEEGQKYIRLCFAKKDSTLAKAISFLTMEK
jgi:aspartate/methionine/tyrosine aminotransferase